MAVNRRDVLVSFREWKRPVTFYPSRSGEDRKFVLEEIKRTFADVADDSVFRDCLLQVRSGDWGGEFVDVQEDASISDRAVLRIVSIESSSSNGGKVSTVSCVYCA